MNEINKQMPAIYRLELLISPELSNQCLLELCGGGTQSAHKSDSLSKEGILPPAGFAADASVSSGRRQRRERCCGSGDVDP